ncbi:MAG: tetratricopeptide repeat protein [Candidatus Zixiibacteriota bacterium]|jgi:tetratricopeptide (TPR) repeat protein
MKIKKKKEKPILKRARKPAEAEGRSGVKKFFDPIIKRWKIIAAVAGGLALAGAAVGGYFWYRHDREVRAARAYAHVQERITEFAEEKAADVGEEGRIDPEELAAFTTTELENVIERFGDTATGRAAKYELASLRFERKDYKGAAELFGQVERDGSGLSAVLAAKGVADCHKAQGEYDAAIEGYKAIFEAHRDEFPNVPVAMDLAGCYRDTGNYDEAAKLYRYVLDYHRLSPYSGDADLELKKIEAIKAAGE